MRARRLSACLIGAAILLAACSSGGGDVSDASRATGDTGASTSTGVGTDAATTSSPDAAAVPAKYAGYESDVYSDPAAWLCRPAAEDVCDTNMDAAVIAPDGTTEIERWAPAEDPPVDCFYVYPTISVDDTPTSDMHPGENEELFVVRQQAARLGTKCRVFAPVYRQLTLTTLMARLSGNPTPGSTPAPVEFPYDDVLDAWKHYMANDNDGRGVVLIGHSQGAAILTRLVKEEIDGDATMRARLVSALLIGIPVRVPAGADVGGDFAELPLCRASDQTGCVVAYSTFRDTSPPPESSIFGHVTGGGPTDRAACVNPAAPGGGSAGLHPYFPTDGRALPGGTGASASTPEWVDPELGVTIGTPFVALPGMVDAKCVERGEFSYLEIHVDGDPTDPRIDDIGGDLTPEWGMHLVDVSVAMGDLVDLVGSQARAYVAG